MRKNCRDCGKTLDGKHYSYCKTCSSKHSLERYYRLHPDAISQSERRKKTKPIKLERIKKIATKQDKFDQRFTNELHTEIMQNHDGCCEICGDLPKQKRLAVDHCHNSGVIRGLLCVKCNLLLGYARDREYILQSAIRYLAKHS